MNLQEIHNMHGFLLERLVANTARLRRMNEAYFGADAAPGKPPATPAPNSGSQIIGHMDHFRAANRELGDRIAELESEIDRLSIIFLDNDGPQHALTR